MKKLKWPVTFLLILVLSTGVIRGDDDENEQYEGRESKGSVYKLKSQADFNAVTNPKYKAECASCHMAYLPGLLPAKSWETMMSTLDKHFGENAELDAKTQKEITDFLVQNSADKVRTKRGDKMIAGLNKGTIVLRISETDYFKRKHDELNSNIYKRKSIGSAANCIACHSGAERGDFSEDNVVIPKDTVIPKKKI
jgi:hypothetical protein